MRIYIFFLAAILSLSAFFMQPFNDDWFYLSSPHLYDFSLLLPNAAFWRPIDAIIGFVVGKYPFLFPTLNHLIVIITYWIALLTLYKVLQRMKINKTAINFSLLLFVVSPALTSSFFSVDSTNQTCSLAFGCLSLLSYITIKKNILKYTITYLCVLLSLFSKESGISWFVIVPLIDMLLKARGWQDFKKLDFYKKNAFIPILLALLLISTYFIFRGLLSDMVPQQEIADNYKLHLGLNVIKGLGLITGACFTCFDTVAWFVDRNWAFVVVSAFVSFIFILYLLKGTITHKKEIGERFYLLVGLAVAFVASAAPHIVMGHPGELHAYPSLWIACLIMAVLLNAITIRRKEKIVGLLFLLTSLCVFIHKGYYMHLMGQQAIERTESVIDGISFIPSSVLVLDTNKKVENYSTFMVASSSTWSCCKSLVAYFNYKMPQIEYRVIPLLDLDKWLHNIELIKQYDQIWIVSGNSVEIKNINDK